MKNKRRLTLIVFSIIILVIITLMQDKIRQLLSLAAPVPANIVVDTKNTLGPLNSSWQAFAQGGEEPPPMLTSVVSKIKLLNPRYIRLDHIYDYYNIVGKNGNQFTYDFSTLDKTVDDILSTGALPFFSLSYMPRAFTSTGSVIDVPADWNNWKNLVRATIEHYSGKNNRNLSNIYYEVWNEPELPQFGGWNLTGNKDYRLLYYHSARGAAEAQNTNNFFIGGPAVGSYYPNWVTDFVSYIEQNNLRLDFFSWHRYSRRTEIFDSDAKGIRNNLSSSKSFSSIPLILTEWGIESANDPINSSNQAAAFTVSAISKFYKDLSLAFNFEAKDGPYPNGGKWGLITHEKDPQNPLSEKPRYKIFNSLSKLNGNLMPVTGEGTFVTGIASKDNDTTKLILVNYDPLGSRFENVPVTVTGLNPAFYKVSYTYPLTGINGSEEIISTNGIVSKKFILSPNSVILISIETAGKLAMFIPGANGGLNNQALVLSNIDSNLNFVFPEFRLYPEESISFYLKPLWDKTDQRTFMIFESPYSIESGIINKVFLEKKSTPQGSSLIFGISGNNSQNVTLSIDSWDYSAFHKLNMGWTQNKIYMAVDDFTAENAAPVDIRNGRILTFYPILAAIDNLVIKLGDNVILKREFDGSIAR